MDTYIELRIAALNVEGNDDHFNTSDVKATTKEAQEAELFGLYNKALSLDKQGERKEARNVLLEVLSNPLIKAASSDGEGSPQQLLALKYSTYKNVAAMCEQQEDWDQALQYYLQAVLVDETDVTVWFKVGKLALKLHHYLLASHSFQQGLQCNPRHWPCLDHSLTLLYALGNYHSCLYWVSRALLRDPGYVKALVLLHQIYKEQASLRQHSLAFFKQCDPVVWDNSVTEEEQAEVVEEALAMRRKKRELSAPELRQNTKLRRPLTQHTWAELGERLVELYDHISSALNAATSTQSSKVVSTHFSSPVDLSDCLLVSPLPLPTRDPSPKHTPPTTHTPAHTPALTVETPGGQEGSEDQCGTTESEMDSSQLFESEDPIPRGGVATKRRKLWQMQEEWGGKRRSTRVRNVVHRKQEESINYQELLTKFLPRSLREGRQSDPQALTLEPCAEVPVPPVGTGGTRESELPAGQCVVSVCDTQTTEVRSFIHRHNNNKGVLSLMGQYLRQLAKSALYKWPVSLCEVYVDVHNRYRKHIEYPNYFCKDDSEQYIQEMAQVLLLSRELQVDRWSRQKSHLAPLSPRKSPCGGTPSCLGPDFPGPHFSEDLCYLTGLSVFTHILGQNTLSFSLRVFWMQGKYLLLENNTEEALQAFCKVLESLQTAANGDKPTQFFLPNVRTDPLISLTSADRQVSNLRRFQSLEEVHRLYEAGDHQRVVTLLEQTFHADAGQLTDATERHQQLQLLQECLTELREWRKCVVWSELSLREAVRRYRLTSKSHRAEWLNTISKLMEGTHRCLTEDKSAVAALPSKSLVQFTQNLLWLLELSLENVDPTEPPIPLPWILLYRLVKCEETAPPTDELPCSLMLLNFAHDSLGRRGWCVGHEGRLLQFIVDELMGELTRSPEPHPLKEELEEMLDQCFYCMYGHPNKKTKARHLQDHGVAQIELTWERAQCVFDYFKPKSMPEYDSYRTSTVAADLENLLKRIVHLIPPQAALTGNTIESVTSYIEGTTSHAPSITEIHTDSTLVVREIYYLLGDYYFKNKETGKAIKFYLHDLCVNPEHFDSWAGMALARASRLEQRLNSHELKNEPNTVQKQANSALRCFRRALDIDNSNSKLWIEYAGLAFQLHSYLSRTLKQSCEFPLPEDTVLQTRSRCSDLLTQAQRAYTQAGSGEEEEEPWLQHYMLGKIAEKMGEQPQVFLQHYHKSAEYLHEERAKYPKKITYIHSPPYLSVEALEVFYRLHVSTIKYLMHFEAEVLAGTLSTPLYLAVFEEYTKQSLSGNFAQCKEKDKPKFKFNDSGKTEGEGRDPSVSGSGQVKVKTPTRASRLDHTYSSMSRLKAQRHQQASLMFPVDLSQDTLSSSSSLCSPSPSLSSPHFTNPAITPPLSHLTPHGASSTITVSSATTSLGSTPLIGDMSFSTPVSVARVKGVLPTGITPLPNQVQEKDTAAKVVPAVSNTTATATNPEPMTTDRMQRSSLTEDFMTGGQHGMVSSSPVGQRMKPTTPSSIVDSPASSRTGLNFSVDSILGLSSTPKSDNREEVADERAEVTTLKKQGTMEFEVSGEPLKESGEGAIVKSTVDAIGQKKVTEQQGEALTDTRKSVSPHESSEQREENTATTAVSGETAVGTSAETTETTQVKTEIAPVKIEVKTEVKTEEPAVKQETSEVNTNIPILKLESSEVNTDISEVKVEAESTDVSVLPSDASSVKPEPTAINAGAATQEDTPIIDIRSPDVNTSGTSAIITKLTGVNEHLSDIQAYMRLILDDLLTKVVESGNQRAEIAEATELYRQSTLSPPPPALNTAKSISPPKLTSPQKYPEPPLHRGPSLEMPVLELMDTSTEETAEQIQRTELEKLAKELGTGSGEGKEREVGGEKKTEDEPMDSDGRTGDGDHLKGGDKEVAMDIDGSEGDCKKAGNVESNDVKMDSESKEDGQKTGEQKKEDEKDVRERYEKVLRQAMQGLEICLNRFPHHYKSLYRLAYVYANSNILQDRRKTRDLLLGSEGSWQEKSHMPCPGLFQERKNANFFQGMWRIPVEEIDRSGSFATHMAKCLRLLFETLVSLRDHSALYQVHTALNRTPEQGKKYLRDSDRTLLATQAYTKCFDVIETKLPDMDKCEDEEQCKKFLLDVHRFWQHGVRQQIGVKRINQVFGDAFTATTQGKVIVAGISVLEKAIKYCSQLTAKAQSAGSVKTPETTGSALKPPSKGETEVKAAGGQETSVQRTQGGEIPIPAAETGGATTKRQGGSSELRKYLTTDTGQTTNTIGPDEELEVLVLDESHIEINISPRKHTPNTGSEDGGEEGRLNEVTGVWETTKTSSTSSNNTKTSPISSNNTKTSPISSNKTSSTGDQSKPKPSSSIPSSSTKQDKQTKPQEKQTKQTKTKPSSEGQYHLLKKSLEAPSSVSQQPQNPQYHPQHQQQQQTPIQVWESVMSGQTGARAVMQQLVLQEQARQQAEAIRQADGFSGLPSAGSMIEQMLMHEQASGMGGSSGLFGGETGMVGSASQLYSHQTSTAEEVMRQLINQQQQQQQAARMTMDGDSDSVIILSSSDSE